MDRRRRIILIALAVLIGAAYTPSSYAQFGGVVYDPRNHWQNRLTALRSYSQLIRQGTQLRNEAQMLINDAKQLSRLDANARNELLAILDDIARLNIEAENIAYEVDETKALLEHHYPQDYTDYTQDDFAQAAEAQWQISRAAFHDAMIMQSKMVESLESDRQLLGQLLDNSHSAVGQLQASQSTNQLLGLLIKQGQQAQHMHITQSRAISLEQSRRISIERESLEKRKTFLGSNSAYNGGTR